MLLKKRQKDNFPLKDTFFPRDLIVLESVCGFVVFILMNMEVSSFGVSQVFPHYVGRFRQEKHMIGRLI